MPTSQPQSSQLFVNKRLSMFFVPSLPYTLRSVPHTRTGKHRDIEASCKAIMELTATDLLNTAQEIFRPERLSMLVYT